VADAQPELRVYQGGENSLMELLIIVVLSLILVPLVILASGALRIVLGLAFILFFPGYTLVAAFFPRKGDLGGVERLALSFGLSIAVVPLIGLVLNYTPWGIRLYPIMLSVLGFIIILTAVALYRRSRIPSGERYAPRLSFTPAALGRSWANQGQWDRILTIVLAAAIICAIGTLGYAIAKPKVGEKFTEFYILGPEAKAENYPRELTIGENAGVMLGIVNQEQETTSYRVEVVIAGEKVADIEPVALAYGEKWEQMVNIAPTRAGPGQKAEFILYKGAEPYRTLHLWIDVKNAP
jgi:uncharacterized membrane protein